METGSLHQECQNVLSNLNELVGEQFPECDQEDGTIYIPVCVDVSASTIVIRTDKASSLKKEERDSIQHFLATARLYHPNTSSSSSSSSSPSATLSSVVNGTQRNSDSALHVLQKPKRLEVSGSSSSSSLSKLCNRTQLDGDPTLHMLQKPKQLEVSGSSSSSSSPSSSLSSVLNRTQHNGDSTLCMLQKSKQLEVSGLPSSSSSSLKFLNRTQHNGDSTLRMLQKKPKQLEVSGPPSSLSSPSPSLSKSFNRTQLNGDPTLRMLQKKPKQLEVSGPLSSPSPSLSKSFNRTQHNGDPTLRMLQKPKQLEVSGLSSSSPSSLLSSGLNRTQHNGDSILCMLQKPKQLEVSGPPSSLSSPSPSLSKSFNRTQHNGDPTLHMLQKPKQLEVSGLSSSSPSSPLSSVLNRTQHNGDSILCMLQKPKQLEVSGLPSSSSSLSKLLNRTQHNGDSTLHMLQKMPNQLEVSGPPSSLTSPSPSLSKSFNRTQITGDSILRMLQKPNQREVSRIGSTRTLTSGEYEAIKDVNAITVSQTCDKGKLAKVTSTECVTRKPCDNKLVSVPLTWYPPVTVNINIDAANSHRVRRHHNKKAVRRILKKRIEKQQAEGGVRNLIPRIKSMKSQLFVKKYGNIKKAQGFESQSSEDETPANVQNDEHTVIVSSSNNLQGMSKPDMSQQMAGTNALPSKPQRVEVESHKPIFEMVEINEDIEINNMQSSDDCIVESSDDSIVESSDDCIVNVSSFDDNAIQKYYSLNLAIINEELKEISQSEQKLGMALEKLFVNIKYLKFLFLSMMGKLNAQNIQTLQNCSLSSHRPASWSFQVDSADQKQSAERVSALCYNSVDETLTPQETTGLSLDSASQQPRSLRSTGQQAQRVYFQGQRCAGRGVLIGRVAKEVGRLLEQKKRMKTELSIAAETVKSLSSIFTLTNPQRVKMLRTYYQCLH